MLYSFDMFDTLVTRKTATYDGIFMLVQNTLSANREGYYDFFIENYYSIRKDADLIARDMYCKNGNEEITLYQIYYCMFIMGYIKEDDIYVLEQIEKNVEINNIVGIQKNIDKVKGLITNGNRVVVISDMYLPAKVLSEMLNCVGLYDIKIYVSSEIGKCKWTGNLFRHVSEEENIPFDDWMHFGDNVHSDFEVPCHLGINAKHYTFFDYNDMEKEMLKRGGNQLAYGYIKNTILNNSLKGYAVLGLRYLILVFLPYAIWLLQTCKGKGAYALIFQHNGENLLKKIVEKVSSFLKCDIKIYYDDEQIISEHFREKIAGVFISDYELNRFKCDCDIKFFFSVFDLSNLMGNDYIFIQIGKEMNIIINALISLEKGKTGKVDDFLAGLMFDFDADCLLAYDDIKTVEIKNIINSLPFDNGDNMDFVGMLQWPPLTNKYYLAPSLDRLQIFKTWIMKENDEWLLNYNGIFLDYSIKRSLKVIKAKTYKYTLLLGIAKVVNTLWLHNLYLWFKRYYFYQTVNNKRIVIYGAGSYGELIYSKISQKSSCKIVGWVDKNKKGHKDGLYICAPEDILPFNDFDIVIIAVLSPNVVLDIKTYISKLGVDSKKIKWVRSRDIFE